MKRDLLTRAALLAGFLTAPLTGVAAAQQTTSNDAFTLGELVVTARARDGEMLGGAVVGQEEMRNFDRQSVDEAMDLIPGAAMSNTGGSRNERLIFIRGFDRFQTTLSIDGVRVFLPADNRIDFGRFLTADLAQIQVSKGYVSVLDGPGGLGGAINLVTRRPSEPFEAELVANASFDGDATYNGYNLSGRIGTRQDQFYLQASGAVAERDHFALSEDFTPTALQSDRERVNSDSEDWRVNLKAGYTPNATDEYAISYMSQSGEKNAPYHVTDTASTRFWDWPYWDIDSVYFLSTTRLWDRATLRTRFYVNSFDNLLSSYDDAAQTLQTLPRAFDSYYEDTAYGGNVQLALPLSASNTIQAALHFRRDQHKERQDGFLRLTPPAGPPVNQAYSEPWQTTEEDTYSVALEDTQSFGEHLDLVVGVSYDWTDLRRAEDYSIFATGNVVTELPVTYPLNDMDAFNWQAALTYRFSDDARIYGSVSSRTRFPTLFERFSSRFGTAVPNPDIGAERATNFEIGGAAALSPTVRAEGAVFYSSLDDALIQIPVALGGVFGTVSQTQNVAEGEYYGLEASVTAEIADNFRLGGNYTYIERDLADPTNPAFEPQGVPNHKLFVYADWRLNQALTLTPSIEYASDRWTVTSSSAVSPPQFYETGTYTLLNLVAAWQMTPHVDLLVGGRNLLDQNYLLVDGFPEEGRNFYLSLRLRN